MALPDDISSVSINSHGSFFGVGEGGGGGGGGSQPTYKWPPPTW
jgi:hypothetical protein